MYEKICFNCSECGHEWDSYERNDQCPQCGGPGDEDATVTVMTEAEAEDRYREMLRETNGDIEVSGMTFDADRILEELDPTAYRVGFSDYTSEMEADGYKIE